MIIRDKSIVKELKRAESGKKKEYLAKEGRLHGIQVCMDKEGKIPVDYEVYAIVCLKESLIFKPCTYYVTIINQDDPRNIELSFVKEKDVEILDPSLPKSWISKSFDKPLEMISSEFGRGMVTITKISGYRCILEDLSLFAYIYEDSMDWLAEKFIVLAKQSEEDGS